MKKILLLLTLVILHSQQSPKLIAITFDDLPVSRGYIDYNDVLIITKNLIQKVKEYKVPAVGFVVGNKIYNGNTKIEKGFRALQLWLDAGLELANHTFDHPDLHKTACTEYIRNIAMCDSLLEELGAFKQIKYFRHPLLHTGRSAEIKDSIAQYLTSKNYTIAPVTIDNSEWIYSLAYDNAIEKRDSSAMKMIGESYIGYMIDKIRFFEKNSFELFGRYIPQVLLAHSNRLNSDYFGKLCKQMIEKGMTFVSLDKALQDDAYRLGDPFYGKQGISWIHRWALARKVPRSFFDGEPACPKNILDLAGMESE